MGILSKASLALSALFVGAPRAEVDRVNATLHAIAEDQGYDIKLPPTDPWRPNRKQRRSYINSKRARDRNTAFGTRYRPRSPISPQRLHETTNDKGYQLALHPLTYPLLVKGGYVKQGGEAA